MASALGISTRRVDSLTFAFATGLAGVAGCILAYLYTIKYTMGNDYIVEAFMVVILGGMGQLGGSVVGGVLYGTALALSRSSSAMPRWPRSSSCCRSSTLPPDPPFGHLRREGAVL